MLFFVVFLVSERPVSAAALESWGKWQEAAHQKSTFALITKAKCLCFSRKEAVHYPNLNATGIFYMTQFLSGHTTEGYKINKMMLEQE